MAKVMNDQGVHEQAKDAGMALVLILLLFVLLGREEFLLLPATVCLVLVMSVPAVFAPWARVWFGFSHLLGKVVSKIILIVIFYGMAVPIGILRRICGADPMRIKFWKQGKASVFVNRNCTMTKRDIERPY